MGSPLALTSPTFACEAWRTFDDISLLDKGDVQTIQGKATSVGMASRIVTYQRPDGLMKEIPYDYLVVATGMKRSWPIVPRALKKESFIDDVNEHVRSIGDAKRVVVVGGGESLSPNKNLFSREQELWVLNSPPKSRHRSHTSRYSSFTRERTY